MVRRQCKNHSKVSKHANDKPGDLEPPARREQRSEPGKIDHRELGGTVSESVAEILNKIPVLRSGRQQSSDFGERADMQHSAGIERKREFQEIQMQATDQIQKIRTADSVRETINQDGAVLLDIKQGLCFSMNPVGSKIWEMLKKEHSLDEIARALEVEFQVPRSQIDADIVTFIAELRKRNLIEEDVPAKKEEKGTWISRLMRKPARS